MANSQEQIRALTLIMADIGENLLNTGAGFRRWIKVFAFCPTASRQGCGCGIFVAVVRNLGKSGGNPLPKHKLYEKLCNNTAGVLDYVFW